MKRRLFTFMIGLAAFVCVQAKPSILDIKHSITDDNIVAPESFETKTLELEEGFYLKNYSADAASSSTSTLATPEIYQKRLAALPTEIEMPYNDVVKKFIEMYLGKRSKLVGDLVALHSYYGPIFVTELEKEGMPLELQYLPVIESAINPNAVSRAGATGLWQFMPGTAKGLGMEVNTLVDQRRDPIESSKAAAKYLKQLYGIYGDWSLAIAAYNCGPGNVNKALKRAGGGNKDFWEIYNYLPTETRGYVPAFIAANYVMNYYKEHGVQPRVIKKPLVTDTVTVSNRVNFNQISAVLNIPVEEIRMLNPQYRKDVIPGNNHPYTLTLPAGQILSYVMSEDEILNYNKSQYSQRTYVEPGKKRVDTTDESDTAEATNVTETVVEEKTAQGTQEVVQITNSEPVKVTHTVARGESLRDIAKKYNVSATDIKGWNNLRRAKVKEGDVLVIEVTDRNIVAPSTTSKSTSNALASNSDVPAPPAKKTTTQPSVPAPKSSGSTTASSANTYVPAPSKSKTPATTQPAVPAPKSKSTTTASTSGNTSTTKAYTPATKATASTSKSTSTAAQETTSRKTARLQGSGTQSTSKNTTAYTGKNNKSATTTASTSKKSTASDPKSNSKNSKTTDSKNGKNGKNGKSNTKEQTAKASKPITHTIEKGESLEKLAKKNNTTVEAIKKANNMKDDKIKAGDDIKIPKNTKPAEKKDTKKDTKSTSKNDSKKDTKKDSKSSGKSDSKKDTKSSSKSSSKSDSKSSSKSSKKK